MKLHFQLLHPASIPISSSYSHQGEETDKLEHCLNVTQHHSSLFSDTHGQMPLIIFQQKHVSKLLIIPPLLLRERIQKETHGSPHRIHEASMYRVYPRISGHVTRKYPNTQVTPLAMTAHSIQFSSYKHQHYKSTGHPPPHYSCQLSSKVENNPHPTVAFSRSKDLTPTRLFSLKLFPDFS